MFERITKRVHPTGWPTEVEVRELLADEAMPFFRNGPPRPEEIQNALISLSVYTTEGERIFPTAEAVGKVPMRMMGGLIELTGEVMRLNTPRFADDTERPT